MPANNFTWCDLSTFDLEQALRFYARVFGWSSQPMQDDRRGDDYTLCYAGEDASAAIYTMPEFFQSIDMPSFWMSYVHVDSLERKVALATELGAKCEIEPTAFDADGRFALVRDPAGAGFTLHEGLDLDGRDALARHGRMCWNELHVPSLEVVGSFYEALFDWKIKSDATPDYRYIVQTEGGEAVASILVLDEATKGPKNYWAVMFAVDDLDAVVRSVTEAGGSVLMMPSTELPFAMATDDQGAMFCVTENGDEISQ